MAERIMIVDDEPELIKALGMRLKASGYDVITATDGVTATQVAIRERPDLIILDIGLPGGDGHTVAQRLNENLNTVSIPVIYLTARNSQRDLRQASSLGAVGYMTKPFKADKLLHLVENALEGRIPAA